MRGDKTQDVRELAAERGFSERTAWRWFAAMDPTDIDELLEYPGNCRYCRTPLPDDATFRRRYCDDICRQYHRRVRQARAARTQRHEPK